MSSKGAVESRRGVSGILGENLVCNELLWRGWIPVNTNIGYRNTPNVDIFAAKGKDKVALQIKASTDSANKSVQVGYGERKKFFNGKPGPTADFIIFVRIFDLKRYDCYIVPVKVAESAVARGYNNWSKTPKRDGQQRSAAFPASIRFMPNKNRPNYSNYEQKWAVYLDAWEQLESP